MNSSAAPLATLPVMEHFYTLQGEGAFSGQAAYFIRLGGCDVGCVWCDVKESWDASKHPQFTVDEMTDWVTRSGAPLCVITGGEPLLHQLDTLTSALQQQGVRTHIETSASSPLSGKWNWICVSPKKFKAPLPEILSVANELKIVVFNTSDFTWAEQHAQHVPPSCRLFLQPEWDKREKMLPLMIDYVKQHPQWTISLQTHKYLNIP